MLDNEVIQQAREFALSCQQFAWGEGHTGGSEVRKGVMHPAHFVLRVKECPVVFIRRGIFTPCQTLLYEGNDPLAGCGSGALSVPALVVSAFVKRRIAHEFSASAASAHSTANCTGSWS